MESNRQGKHYLFSRDERGVGTLTLNRPEIHNAFNDELLEELKTLLEELREDKKIKVLVLTGAGQSFCAGADLNWMKKMKDYTEGENYRDSLALAEMFETLNKFPAPVVGKINGAALGGGAGLMAVCDYAYAVEGAKIGFTEVKLGLVPAVISPYVIAKIGESQARAFFLNGRRFDSKKALEMGLVHEVASKENFEEGFDKLIGEYLTAGPGATRLAKDLIRNVLKFEKESKESVMVYTCTTISKARISGEGQEGMSALLEKRRPKWPGGVSDDD